MQATLPRRYDHDLPDILPPEFRDKKIIDHLATVPSFTEQAIADLRVRQIAHRWATDWRAKKLPHQRARYNWWTIWLMLAGRGAGKTRVASQEIAGWAITEPNTRWLVSAPTYAALDRVCFNGVSGLISVIPPELIVKHNRSECTIELFNGSKIFGISAENPESFRGPEFHGAWLDEYASWQRAQASFDLLMFSMRLGKKPRIIISTTPKPRKEIRALLKREDIDVKVTRGSTYDNIDNLAPTFRNEILQYEGTQLGRQEIHAEVLDPEEQGIVKRSWLQMWPGSKSLPEFLYIVVSLDTAFTEKDRDKKTAETDPTACTVWGLFRNEKGDYGILLLETWAEHLGFPQLIDKARGEMKARYGDVSRAQIKPIYGKPYLDTDGRRPDVLLIEEKGSGISLRQVLDKEGLATAAYNPGRANKLERLHAVSHIFAAKMVWVPEGSRIHEATGQRIYTGDFAQWTHALIEQLCSYAGEGTTDHDDLTDSTAQGIRLIMDQYKIKVHPQPKSDGVESDYRHDRRDNPYTA